MDQSRVESPEHSRDLRSTPAKLVRLVSIQFASVLLASAGCLAPVLAGAALFAPLRMEAQAASSQMGTVASISGSTLVLKTAAGAELTVTVDADAKVLQLAPGSKSLQAATAATLSDVAVGDRVLATGAAGSSPTILTASRVIVMKSADIAARNASEQADWRQHGVSGLVHSIAGPEITLSSALHTVKVDTTPTTVVRRYAAGSINFSSAVPATLSEIHVGDQMSVRGTKSADGSQIAAQEIVAGTFTNLSGVIGSVDANAGTLTLKDLVTKRNVTVQITSSSDLRSLPAQAANAFAARNQSATPEHPGSAAAAPSGEPAGEAARARHAGMDLSRMLSRLPEEKLSDLKTGEAVMIVASQAEGTGPLAVITLLSGVEPLLSARGGQSPITLSPWTLGTPDEGASQ